MRSVLCGSRASAENGLAWVVGSVRTGCRPPPVKNAAPGGQQGHDDDSIVGFASIGYGVREIRVRHHLITNVIKYFWGGGPKV